ncbi:MAG: hypothetical protein M0T74_01540 [Desulfitobacterium hafniense]|nr:hypothetical protein [Desulfitobacterium hafniense]
METIPSKRQLEEFEKKQELRRRQEYGEPYQWRFVPFYGIPTRYGGYWQQRY